MNQNASSHLVGFTGTEVGYRMVLAPSANPLAVPCMELADDYAADEDFSPEEIEEVFEILDEIPEMMSPADRAALREDLLSQYGEEPDFSHFAHVRMVNAW